MKRVFRFLLLLKAKRITTYSSRGGLMGLGVKGIFLGLR
jgi:hypothetical protein